MPQNTLKWILRKKEGIRIVTAHQTLDNTSGESRQGKKDRMVPISAKLVELLRYYYRFKKLSFYLFEELLSLKNTMTVVYKKYSNKQVMGNAYVSLD